MPKVYEKMLFYIEIGEQSHKFVVEANEKEAFLKDLKSVYEKDSSKSMRAVAFVFTKVKAEGLSSKYQIEFFNTTLKKDVNNTSSLVSQFTLRKSFQPKFDMAKIKTDLELKEKVFADLLNFSGWKK